MRKVERIPQLNAGVPTSRARGDLKTTRAQSTDKPQVKCNCESLRAEMN